MKKKEFLRCESTNFVKESNEEGNKMEENSDDQDTKMGGAPWQKILPLLVTAYSISSTQKDRTNPNHIIIEAVNATDGSISQEQRSQALHNLASNELHGSSYLTQPNMNDSLMDTKEYQYIKLDMNDSQNGTTLSYREDMNQEWRPLEDIPEEELEQVKQKLLEKASEAGVPESSEEQPATFEENTSSTTESAEDTNAGTTIGEEQQGQDQEEIRYKKDDSSFKRDKPDKSFWGWRFLQTVGISVVSKLNTVFQSMLSNKKTVDDDYDEVLNELEPRKPTAFKTLLQTIYQDASTRSSSRQQVNLETVVRNLVTDLEPALNSSDYRNVWNKYDSSYLQDASKVAKPLQSTTERRKYGGEGEATSDNDDDGILLGGNKKSRSLFIAKDPLALISRVESVFHAKSSSSSLRPEQNPYGNMYVINVGTVNEDPAKSVRIFNQSMEHKQPLESFKVYLDDQEKENANPANLTTLFLYFSHLFQYSANKPQPLLLPDLTTEKIKAIRKDPVRFHEFEDLIHQSYKQLFLRLNDLHEIYLRLVITFSPVKCQPDDVDYARLNPPPSASPAIGTARTSAAIETVTAETGMKLQMNVRLSQNEVLTFGKVILNLSLNSLLSRSSTTSTVKEDILMYRLKIYTAIILHSIASRNVVPGTNLPAIERIRFIGPCILFQEVLQRVFHIQIEFKCLSDAKTLYFILTDTHIKSMTKMKQSEVEYLAINVFAQPKYTLTPSIYQKIQTYQQKPNTAYKSNRKPYKVSSSSFSYKPLSATTPLGSITNEAKRGATVSKQDKQIAEAFELAERDYEKRKLASMADVNINKRRKNASGEAIAVTANPKVLTRKVQLGKKSFRSTMS